MMRNEPRKMLPVKRPEPWQDEAQWKKLVITHVENPCTFCAQDCQHKSTIQTVTEHVNYYGSRSPRLNTRPEKDKVYAARYHLDGNWYRCKVKSYAPNGAKVLYLDFGNTSTISYNEIALLPPQLQWVPPLCQKYRLEGVKPAMAALGEAKHNEGKKWLMSFARGVIVNAYTYRKPKFYAWIADCWINDVNLSARVLSMGFALPNAEAAAAAPKVRNGTVEPPIPAKKKGPLLRTPPTKFQVTTPNHKAQVALQKRIKALEKETKALQAAKATPMIKQTLPLIARSNKLAENKDEDILLQGVVMLKSPITPSEELSEQLAKIKELEKKLNAAQTAIKQAKLKEEAESKAGPRNDIRIELHNKLTEYLSQGVEVKERYDKIKETTELIQKTYGNILSKASKDMPVSDIDSAVEAYKKWKEEKKESLVEQHKSNIQLREDLSKNLNLLAVQVTSDEFDLDKIPDLEGSIAQLRDSVRKEIRCMNPDKDVVGGLARTVKAGLSTQSDTISSIATSYEKYSTVALDMERWLNSSPDIDSLRGLQRNLRTLRSRMRRKLVDLMDEKEEHGDVDGDGMKEMKKNIGEMKDDLKQQSQEMEKKMEELKYVISEHFPELPLLNPDIHFSDKINWSEVDEEPQTTLNNDTADDDVQMQLAELKKQLEQMTEEDE